MDKLLRRVRMAEGMAARRTQRKNTTMKRIIERKNKRRNGETFTEAIQQRKAAVVARHEDWTMGPLAPRRELGEADDLFGNFYGTISPSRTMLNSQISEEEKKARVAWCGSPKFLCIAEGDRVVVIEGHHKDLIGTIEKLHTDNMTVEIASEKLKVSTPTEPVSMLFPCASFLLGPCSIMCIGP